MATRKSVRRGTKKSAFGHVVITMSCLSPQNVPKCPRRVGMSQRFFRYFCYRWRLNLSCFWHPDSSQLFKEVHQGIRPLIHRPNAYHAVCKGPAKPFDIDYRFYYHASNKLNYRNIFGMCVWKSASTIEIVK